MQAVREKLQDISAMRKAKAEAKAEEKAEKELAKARMEVAHEVRLAKEAEAAMDLHVAKAGVKADKAEKDIMEKCSPNHPAANMAGAPGPTMSPADMAGLPGTVNMAGPPPPAKKLL